MNATSNARWIAIGQAARVLSQFVNLLVLARLLPPADFGLMAMASVVTNLALVLRDLGTASAVIQKRELTDDTTTTVFWLNLGLGCAIALGLLGCSPLIAQAFASPALVPVLCLLSLIFPVTGASAVHQALMERRCAFPTLARIEIVSALTAMACAIAAVLLGAGVYSLVFQAIALAFVSSAQLWAASRWRPKGRWRWPELRGVLAFSSQVATSQLVGYLLRNVDAMVVGRFLGAGALGIYSIAYKLMLFPVQNLSWVAARALYPVMSRQQDALPLMAGLYLRSLQLISFVAAPLMVCVFVLREPFVLTVLGRPWLAVAEVLAWLAPVGYLQSLSSTVGVVLMAQGRTRLLMQLSILGALVHVAAFVVGVRWGITGVAAAYLFASILTSLPSLFMALRSVGQSALALLRGLLPSVALALLIGGALHLAATSIVVTSGHVLLKLAVLGSAGLALYLSLCLAIVPEQTRMVLSRFGLGHGIAPR